MKVKSQDARLYKAQCSDDFNFFTAPLKKLRKSYLDQYKIAAFDFSLIIISSAFCWILLSLSYKIDNKIDLQ